MDVVLLHSAVSPGFDARASVASMVGGQAHQSLGPGIFIDPGPFKKVP